MLLCRQETEHEPAQNLRATFLDHTMFDQTRSQGIDRSDPHAAAWCGTSSASWVDLVGQVPNRRYPSLTRKKHCVVDW